MKNWKQGIILAILAVFGIVGIFIACDKDNSSIHTHEWEWLVTQEGSNATERIETETCKIDGATRGTRTVPINREITITVAISRTDSGNPSSPESNYTSRTATVKGTLTFADLTTISDKLTTAIDAAFGNADFLEGIYFLNVFGHFLGNIVTVIIENDVSYDTYEADNKFTVRFNIVYLLNASVEDLESEIISAVTAMNKLPME